MKFPSPAVLVITQDDQETVQFAASVNWDGSRLLWEEYTGDHPHALDAVSATEEYGDVNVVLADGGSALVRGLDPYDGVIIAPGAGVPQPLRVLREHILQGGGVAADELTAAVAADNSVATLMLETKDGLFVRYSGDWHRVKDDSESLDGVQIVTVLPSALDVFDKADAAKSTLSIFDLPRIETTPSGKSVEIMPEGLASQPKSMMASFAGTPVVASGISIPLVDTAEDLDTAVRYAAVHPAARWYVTRRAISLNLTASIPPEWLPRERRPF